jgi:hypothetical protein
MHKHSLHFSILCIQLSAYFLKVYNSSPYHFGIINLVPTINMFDIVTMVSVALRDIGSGTSDATVVSTSQVCASSNLMTECIKLVPVTSD